jgi:hypothetical protein
MKDAMASGFGAGIAGAAVGAVAFGSAGGAVAGGLVAGLGSVIVDSSVHNVTYSIITDVQISVRAPKGVKVKQRTKSKLQQGSETQVTQSYNQKTDWMRYRTRVMSYANKVNLKFEEAAPKLRVELASAIANIL